MVTMVDEIFDRDYQAGRNAMNAAMHDALARFGHAIHNAFEVLVKIEYQSPWTAKQKRVRCN